MTLTVPEPRTAAALPARRADVTRAFLYDNAEARAAVAAAMEQAGERRTLTLAEQDDEREATWRERALNAEEALKAAHTEILTQRTRIGELLRQIRDLEAEWTQEAIQRNSESASSPPTTAPLPSGSRPPASTCASRTSASPTSKPVSPNRPRSPDPSSPTTSRPVRLHGGRAVP
ncbi:hypothetical protein [Streptomyces shenzhenensis]|uniref:hypothetical protein n=1 Tax=Streptomyces shenzhenensis TaxID=943815 RepID=UPI0033C27FAA